MTVSPSYPDGGPAQSYPSLQSVDVCSYIAMPEFHSQVQVPAPPPPPPAPGLEAGFHEAGRDDELDAENDGELMGNLSSGLSSLATAVDSISLIGDRSNRRVAYSGAEILRRVVGDPRPCELNAPARTWRTRCRIARVWPRGRCCGCRCRGCGRPVHRGNAKAVNRDQCAFSAGGWVRADAVLVGPTTSVPVITQ